MTTIISTKNFPFPIYNMNSDKSISLLQIFMSDKNFVII